MGSYRGYTDTITLLDFWKARDLRGHFELQEFPSDNNAIGSFSTQLLNYGWVYQVWWKIVLAVLSKKIS